MGKTQCTVVFKLKKSVIVCLPVLKIHIFFKEVFFFPPLGYLFIYLAETQ